MDQASASPAASCAHNPAAPRTLSSWQPFEDQAQTVGPPPAHSSPRSEPHSEPVHIVPRPSSPALCQSDGLQGTRQCPLRALNFASAAKPFSHLLSYASKTNPIRSSRCLRPAERIPLSFGHFIDPYVRVESPFDVELKNTAVSSTYRSSLMSNGALQAGQCRTTSRGLDLSLAVNVPAFIHGKDAPAFQARAPILVNAEP